MDTTFTFLKNWTNTKLLFSGLAVSMVLGIVLGLVTEELVLFGLPAVFLLTYLAIVDFRKIFYLLLICLPFSTEVELPGGFGTDLPSEPLMLMLTGIFLVYGLYNGKRLNTAFLKHPLTLLLLLHLGWIAITTFQSEQFIFSLKFFLAKIWFVVTFYFLGGYLLKTEKDIRTLFWCVFGATLCTVLIILVRHAAVGFSFHEVNFVLKPFYRNHVSYASLLVLLCPFLWYARHWYPTYSGTWWFLVISTVIFLVATYFTYTRAAYVSLLLAVGAYFIIRFKLMKVAICGALLAGVLSIAYVSTNNNYLEFAPDYNKTITHKNFDNLLEATTRGEDISTMERVYRWVAGFYMVREHPYFGFGPGNFYSFYKSYTVTSFTTYVSDNPEHSGVHSYFLMTAIEQGIFGLLLFLALCFTALLLGEKLYHQTTNPARRRLLLMAVLSLVIIDSILLINDMVETDKVGSFFFLNMALLVNLDLKRIDD